MKTRLMIMAAALSLVACGDKGSDSKAVPTVPETLGFSKPAAGAKLTQDQVKELKQVFAQKSSMMLPPGDLVYIPKSMTPQELQKKEHELATQDPRSYEFLKSIQANCHKGRPTSTVEASFPTDGNAQLSNLRTNDRMSFSTQAVLKEKSSCPVDFDSGAGFSAKVEDMNQDNLSGTISAGMNLNTKALVLNPTYASHFNHRGLLIQSSISGLASLLDTQGKGLLTFKLSGTYYGLNTEIPYNMTIQFLSVGKTKEKKESFDNIELVTARNESILNTELKMSNFTVRIDNHQVVDASGKVLAAETYVNGNLMSQKEFEELFGTKNPAGSVQNNTLVQSLN